MCTASEILVLFESLDEPGILIVHSIIQLLAIKLKGYLSLYKGAQWLSGRVLDSRPKGRGFEPHRRHCVVVLEQDTFILA